MPVCGTVRGRCGQRGRAAPGRDAAAGRRGRPATSAPGRSAKRWPGIVTDAVRRLAQPATRLAQSAKPLVRARLTQDRSSTFMAGDRLASRVTDGRRAAMATVADDRSGSALNYRACHNLRYRRAQPGRVRVEPSIDPDRKMPGLPGLSGGSPTPHGGGSGKGRPVPRRGRTPAASAGDRLPAAH